MINVEEEQNRKTKCFLVGKPDKELDELKGLVKTLEMKVSGTLNLSRVNIQPAFGMGKGKAEEIVNLAKETESDCIVFDFDLEPSKQRNWEKLSELPCIDRQEIIIRIFASRARTKEAVLQVELARLTYSLPRLAHSYGDLARQRGGSYGSKGAGETQLELDQRLIRKRIFQTKKELEKVSKVRDTQQKKRNENDVPECALVGYTNAGKSSLLNAMTGSDSFVEDKLFATLDPLTRKINLKDGKGILLTDTVGFISEIPHTLIDSFKSTLAFAKNASLLLIVIDSSDSDFEKQAKTVNEVLMQIGADKNKRLIVLNKCDILENDEISKSKIRLFFPEGIFVSAKTKEGFSRLQDRITEELFGTIKTYEIPLSESFLVQKARDKGVIICEEWKNDFVLLKCRIPSEEEKAFEKYEKYEK